MIAERAKPADAGARRLRDHEQERQLVVAEARSWIGTRYHHCADVKGMGVDCAMILVRVYQAVGLIPEFDPRPYPPRWHLHQGEERYLGWIRKFAHPVETPGPGDVILWRVGRCFSHGGIVTEWPTAALEARGHPHRVVHAYARAGIVEESDVSLGGELSDPKRPRRFYSLWGGEEATGCIRR
jgi:hypothetical protein